MTNPTNKAVAIKEKQNSILTNYNSEQLSLLRNDIAKGATESELIYFLTVCKSQNLDPFAKQIYFVKRGNDMTIQTGIDGYRAIAENTGQYAGSDDAIFDPKEEDAQHPNKATVTVYKIVQNTRVPFTASARWTEYAPREQKMAFMWNKMAYNMLAKCAEALALRKAFPKVLGKIYTDEEMHQASNVTNVPPTKIESDNSIEGSSESMISSDKVQKIKYLLKEKNRSLGKMLQHFNVEKLDNLTMEEAETAIKMLESIPTPKPTVAEKTNTKVDNDEVEVMPEEESPARKAMKKGLEKATKNK